MKDETDDRMPQFKKKAKELRILDSKTAQNLCTCCIYYYFTPSASYLTACNQSLKSSMCWHIFDISCFCGVDVLILMLLSRAIMELQRTVECDELKHESTPLAVRCSSLIAFSPSVIFTSAEASRCTSSSVLPQNNCYIMLNICEGDTYSHGVLTQAWVWARAGRPCVWMCLLFVYSLWQRWWASLSSLIVALADGNVTGSKHLQGTWQWVGCPWSCTGNAWCHDTWPSAKHHLTPVPAGELSEPPVSALMCMCGCWSR